MRLGIALALMASAAQAAEPRFEDRSDALPAHIYGGGWEHFVGGGVAVFDCDGDALPDIFAAGGENPAILLRNDGEFRFRRGELPPLTGTVGAYPLDMDGDGMLDLFVLRAGPNVALKGGPDCTFTDATEAWGIPARDGWSTAFSAWWEAGEDRPTLAVGNYVDRADPEGPFGTCDDNTILRPVADGYAAQALSPGYCTLSMLAGRDARGRRALRLSNDRHYYISGGHEQMWDIAERRFLGPEDGWPVLALWGMGIASADLDADGRDEVMLTSMGDQVMQMAREDGSYIAAPFSLGTYAQRPHTGGDGRPSTGWHAEFGDVDNDGRSDLFIAKGNVDQMPGMAMRDPNNLLMQRKDGTFGEAAERAGVATLARSRGAALADFDGDGRLDLIVSNRRAPLELYRNVTGETGGWLRVSLAQPGGNRRAIGAQVRVEAGSAVQTRQVLVGGGHAGGQALPLHFGLGEAEGAVVEVRWPDGSEQSIDVAVDSDVVIEKAE